MGIRDRSSSRGGHTVRVLAVHDTEGGGTAQQLRDATWWVGSAHAITDDRSLLTPAEGCVPYERASWTLRSGNPWSENIEIIGFARWTRAEWLQRAGRLDHCARWLADRSRARNIPLVKLTPAQYRAGGRGVIGHVDHTVGYKDGTHWDPGPGFPWDVVLDKARKYAAGQDPEDDMPSAQDLLNAPVRAADGKDYPLQVFISQTNHKAHLAWREAQAANAAVGAQNAILSRLVDALGSKDATLDVEALKAHISAEVDRAQESVRAALLEGYDADVVLKPKPGA